MSAHLATNPSSVTIVELNNLVVNYGEVRALGGINQPIARGEWVGLIGANGAGKTTLLKAVARLIEFEGDITIEGRYSARLTRKQFASWWPTCHRNRSFLRKCGQSITWRSDECRTSDTLAPKVPRIVSVAVNS